MGWPGSVQDTTVFRESQIWKFKSRHFADDEYLLADKGSFSSFVFQFINMLLGYPLSKFTIRPFAANDLTNDPQESRTRRKFNFMLSHLRIKIEHAFGMLKGRFPALRAMPGYDLNAIYTAIEA